MGTDDNKEEKEIMSKENIILVITLVILLTAITLLP